MEKLIKYGLFIFLLVALLLSGWYWSILSPNDPNWQGEKLGGEFERVRQPDWSVDNWLKETFQSDYETFLKTESKNASAFIRFRNQMYLNNFNAIPAETIVLGKEDQLYHTEYCDEYTGRKFLGMPFLNDLVDKIEQVHQQLQKRNKQLLLVFPPGKPRVVPEYLPNFYESEKFAPSNWTTLSNLLKEKQIPFVNHQNFVNQPESYEHPIYTQLGLHWSYYGATVAFEEMNQKIEELLQIKLPTAEKKIVYSSELASEDRELLNAANIKAFQAIDEMPYPKLSYHIDSTITKPKAIVIGDSFYKLQHKIGLHDGFFHSSSIFRYYYNIITPRNASLKGKQLEEAVNNCDIIILSQAEMNLNKTSFGFLDELLKLFDGKDL